MTEIINRRKSLELIPLELAQRPLRLKEWLDKNLHTIVGPSISGISPGSGPRGTILTVTGGPFSPTRWENDVTVGGAPAFVVAATATELKVLVPPDADSGPVEVTVAGGTITSPAPFTITGHPSPGDDTTDGPPVVTTGVTPTPGAGDVPAKGTINVLVVMLQPNDTAPANPTATRNAVDTKWGTVRTFYDQASYGQTVVATTLTAFATLDGTLADFVDTSPSVQNFRPTQLGRIAAIGAQAAVDQGLDLDDYQMIAFVTFTNGTFVRAWGGGSQSTFSYDNGLPVGDPNRISINQTTSNAINTLWINESADWGRFAHEFGHNIVSAPTSSGDGTGTLGEDVYGSDLVDPGAATAAPFEMMANHDSHPLFSGYHLDKLGYYKPENVRELVWDHNANAFTIDVVAHGLTEDTDPSPDRVHLIRIKVSDALSYYVQVRQRPGTTAQVFDDSIPFGASANQGGVVVTRAIAGVMNNNQQTRFITLLHEQATLTKDQFAEDPARALKITVLDDAVQARPLVCRVRVEWAQNITSDPNGSFDLKVEPWGSDYTSPDIWVDRDPFGSFDNALDSQGRPLGNGDRPRVNKVNKFVSRVHVSGATGATNVKVTQYAVTPPGVGDNGNWSPIGISTVSSISANGSADVSCNWVPVVGKHTCLMAYASAQLGEISGQNNAAQENVGDFISGGGSPCEPVLVRTAIRNPVDERRAVQVFLTGVPEGWMAQVPSAWVWLDGRAEKEIDVAIWPTEDLAAYQIGNPRRDDEREDRGKYVGLAPVRVRGQVERSYPLSVMPSGEPAASRFYPIGGVFYRVHVRRKADVKMEVGHDKELGELGYVVHGWVRPAVGDQRVVVDVSEPGGRDVANLVTLTRPDGTFEVSFDLRDAVDRFGPGAYTVQSFIFDADELDDAESNVIQLSV